MDCDFLSGQIILIDKPKGWTSFDVVAKIRNILTKRFSRKIKVGHSGTLDPMATGLLLIGTGKKTKLLHNFQQLDKEYIATIRLGFTTPSFDAETPIDNKYPIDHINEQLIKTTLEKFIGKQKQIPPTYSAKKIKGKRSYQLARSGKKIDLKPIEVEFKQIEILSLNLPLELTLRLLVSKGTYIRAFARDLGKALSSGAYLTQLRRTKIGDFSVDDAISIEEFQNFVYNC